MRAAFLAGTAAIVLLPAAWQTLRAQTTTIQAPTSAGPVVRNEPGISVRLAGRYRFYATFTQQDFANDQQSPAPANNAAGNPPTANSPVGAKVAESGYDFMDYARIWTGFDGMAQNGLRYGANLEVRHVAGSAPRGSDRGTLDFRRMFGYVASPTLGQVRVGSGQVRASELMHTGHIYGQVASGLWDGDVPGAIGPANFVGIFFFSSSGGNNMSAITYLSPQVFGFDAGLSYAPNNGNFGGDASCGVQQYSTTNGGANCDRLAESNLDTQTLRPRNIIDAMLRYRGSFGPVGLSVSGGLVTADTVGATGNAQSYDTILVGLFGAQATVGGFTFGGIMAGGQANFAGTRRADQTIGMTNIAGANATNATTAYGAGTPLQPLPSSSNADSLFFWEIGALYSFGPFTIGGAFHQARYEGSIAVAADTRDQGLGLGASYAVAPGLNVFLEYLYGRRQENGVNLRTGQAGSINNKGTSNTMGLGLAFNW